MRGRASKQDSYMYVCVGVSLGIVWLIDLTLKSEILPWAIMGGAGASVFVLIRQRQRKDALVAGAVVAVLIWLWGILATAAPGWYKFWQ